VPAALTFQAKVTPHVPLTEQQLMDYKMQRSFLGERTETVGSFLLRLEYRVRYYRFFFLAPLYLALGAFLFALGERRFRWVALTLALFALERISFRVSTALRGRGHLPVCAGFGGWPGAHRAPVAGSGAPGGTVMRGAVRVLVRACTRSSTRRNGRRRCAAMRLGSINHGNPERRIFVNRQLDGVPGKCWCSCATRAAHLPGRVGVQPAAIDEARIVWPRDLGDAENRQLLPYYADRTALVLEPDAQPPNLAAYRPPAP